MIALDKLTPSEIEAASKLTLAVLDLCEHSGASLHVAVSALALALGGACAEDARPERALAEGNRFAEVTCRHSAMARAAGTAPRPRFWNPPT